MSWALPLSHNTYFCASLYWCPASSSQVFLFPCSLSAGEEQNHLERGAQPALLWHILVVNNPGLRMESMFWDLLALIESSSKADSLLASLCYVDNRTEFMEGLCRGGSDEQRAGEGVLG